MNLSPDHRIAGILVPLFAIRSENDLGIGDVESLKQFVDWAARIGFRLVQLLPVNETGGDNSPYNAISSVAIDPITISCTSKNLPDLKKDDLSEILKSFDLDKLRKGSVDYKTVKKLKHLLLGRAFKNFQEKRSSKRTRDFENFVKENAAWIHDYTLFRVLMEKHGTEKWDDWTQKDIGAARAWARNQPQEALEERRHYFAYVQWIAFHQWESVKKHADKKGVALMGDVPFGVSYYSADVYANPELFDLQWSGGAPPEKILKVDPFTEKWGQNWGIPNYRWDVMAAQNFAWWRQRVRAVRQMFHLFRIDHILGFYRIYSFPWRPERNEEFLPLSEDEARERTGGELPRFKERDDSTHENAEANRVQGETILKILCEEVGQYRLIGEDLGMVPHYVRPNLASMNIAGFKVPMWENTHHGRFIKGTDYERLSVVTYATHDHDPIKKMWDDLFEAARNGDGGARYQMECFADYAGIHGEIQRPFDEGIHEKMLEAIFRSNSWLAICMITDLLGTTRRFNIPGAIADSNWSERLGQTVKEMAADRDCRKKMKHMTGLLRGAGRLESAEV